jgi:xanthine dehydrogenase accessory factor
MSWIHTLQLVSERCQDAVTVTVASGKGSTPREAGAKMVVTIDALHGTIGGGELEYQAIDLARGMLRGARDRQAKRFGLGANLGQYCGGAAHLLLECVPREAPWVSVAARWHDAGVPLVVVTPFDGEARLLVSAGEAWGSLGDPALDAAAAEAARKMLANGDREAAPATVGDGLTALFEPLQPTDFNIVLFGAGHVGRALVRVLGPVPCRVTWVDSRAGEFPADVPDNVRVVRSDTPAEQAAAAPPGSYFLTMTHSHALDFELVAAVLKRGDFAYCGMIGSQTKRRTFENGLAKHGVPADRLARLTCPIGIAGIKGKEPGAIAVAVAAQLIEHRERGALGAEHERAARA